jgi:hypothetical protein
LSRFQLTTVFGGFFEFALAFVVLGQCLMRRPIVGVALQGTAQPVTPNALVGGQEKNADFC